MRLEMGGGRTVTVNLDEHDKMNVCGVMYPTHCCIEFYEGRGRGEDQVAIFATRDQLKAFAEKILEAISNAVG